MSEYLSDYERFGEVIDGRTEYRDDETDEEAFLTSCRIEHDRDPAEWHRQMLAAPRTRSTECAFCGAAWPVDAAQRRERSEPPK